MSRLEGQVAIVTGGSSGLGAASALRLAEAGADVAITYLSSPDAAREVVSRIESQGRNGIAIQTDVSNEDDVTKLFATTVAALGRVDILVADAGMQKDAPIAEMTTRDWKKVLDVNLTGQFLCVREAVRQMRRQREFAPGSSRARGKIICMSSVHERIPWAGHINYAASKGGIMAMMQTLAQEVAAERIRVNGIAPGAIRTPINHDVWADDAARKKLLQLIPYGRIGEPDDVANAIVWLASDESDYVTGTTLFVDGGMSLYPGFRDNG